MLDRISALPEKKQPLKVAVILNANAQAVDESLIRELGQVVQGESLFVSSSSEQAKFIARTILNKDYDVVLCGGGDGTFSQCVTDIMSMHPKNPPVFGILRLGTGNALATTLGASLANPLGLAADLKLAQSMEAQTRLPLLQVEGKLVPFAGFGLDALILEDYNGVKGTLQKTPLGPIGRGVAGYTLAIATRSFWRFMFQPRPTVLVRNEGKPAQRIDLKGRALGLPVPRRGVLFHGPVSIAAASTIPYYGFGLKLFPQIAQHRDCFQLRVGEVPVHKIISELPALFQGEFNASGICDFLCTAVSIHTEEPALLQAGGEEVGKRSSVFIGLSSIKAVSRASATPQSAIYSSRTIEAADQRPWGLSAMAGLLNPRLS
jgi:diacylglycerol kinase family enzyme